MLYYHNIYLGVYFVWFGMANAYYLAVRDFNYSYKPILMSVGIVKYSQHKQF